MTKATICDAEFFQLLGLVLGHFPLHAEEGGRKDSLAEGELVSILEEAGIGGKAAYILVSMLRRQMDAIALLDRVELAKGKWTFVSFPASLIGRSLLETLAVPNQAIFPSDYWDQGDYRPQSVKEEQRRLLDRIEKERVRLNPSARPVRVVHVAWAVIRLGDRFLLHRREDISRPGEKTHVLPGGRLSATRDLPADVLEADDVLQQIFNVDSNLVDQYIDRTLVEELYEELGLHKDEHYSFERWQKLPPYRQVGGASNRRAFTEYGFHLYTLKLTPLGEVKLLDREAESTALTWFSAAEIAAPQRSDGESAYVDVLHSSWGEEVASQLAAVPDSSASIHSIVGESNTVDLPSSPDVGLLIGKPGKEKILPLLLDKAEWHLLLLLGWHARGFVVHAAEDVRLLGGGWIRVAEEVANTVGMGLQIKVNKLLPGLIEIRDSHYLSLRISPEILMFGTKLFRYRIEGSDREGGTMTLHRQGVFTPWGELTGDVTNKSISGNTLRILHALEVGKDPSDTASNVYFGSDWEKNLREQFLSLRAFGLRRLWKTKLGVSTMANGLNPLTSGEVP